MQNFRAWSVFFGATFLFLSILLLPVSPSHSSEPVVALNARLIGQSPTDYEITVTILHSGKGDSHRVETVILLVNEMPVRTWNFPDSDPPQPNPLILKEKLQISPSGPALISAKAFCTEDGENDRVSLQVIPGRNY